MRWNKKTIDAQMEVLKETEMSLLEFEPGSFMHSEWAYVQIVLFTSSKMAEKIAGKIHLDWLCRYYQYMAGGKMHEISVTPWNLNKIEDEEEDKLECSEEMKL